MFQKYTALMLGVILSFMFASSTFAQDAKKEVKKETKPAVTTTVKKDAQKPATMKNIGCTQSGCGFWAKSHSGKELRYIMKRHAKKYHKTELSDKQLKEMVKKEGAK